MFVVLDWLTAPLASWGSQPVTAAAALGALAFLAGGMLVARGSRRVWPVAALVCAAFAGLAVAEGRFVDAGIRLVIAGVCAYGWRVRVSGRVLHPRAVVGREAAYGVVLFAIATVVLAYALTDQSGDDASWGPAVVVAALFVQLTALARGITAGWWVAAGAALLSFVLALVQTSWPAVVVSIAAVVVSGYGWVRWRRDAVADVDRRNDVEVGVDEDVAA